jgi:hypothetical protein
LNFSAHNQSWRSDTRLNKEGDPMPRLLLISFAILLAAAWSVPALADPYPKPFRVVESKPVIVNDAKFVAVVQTGWKARDKSGARRVVEVQLSITNLKKTDVVFPTFDTFGLTIKNADGKDMLVGWGRDATIVTRPVLIAPGTTYTLCPRAELHWDSVSKSSELLFYDGTLSEAAYRLPAGKYRLSFGYSTAQRAGRKSPEKLGNAPVWAGYAQTPAVEIEIANH